MTFGEKSKPMDVVSGDVRSLDTDLLVIFLADTESPGPEWVEATGGELGKAMASREFCGRLYETFLHPIINRTYHASRLLAVGLGPRADFTVDRGRRAATVAGLLARQKKIGRITLAPDATLVSPDMLQALAEGITLAEFDAGQYKTGDPPPSPLSSIAIAVSGGASAQRAVSKGRLLGECTNITRALANEPSNRLTPPIFADRAASICREAGLRVEVLDETQLAELGMGMLLGVGQGSQEPPRLVAVTYEPVEAPARPVLGLVGKGITFDTGGISIKPAEGMERMKDDMAGGAAVVGAMRAIALLKAPIKVVGVIPIAENMPSGRAIRPGDVLTSASGKTVEVINTDAEGRLILGDALWYAQRLGATHLVDIATLTGAISIALGRVTSGLFGTPAGWVEFVRATAERCGDRCWPMPLYEEYRDLLKSDIADMVNTGGRYGGAITAALFLKEFTGGLPWAHVDIAGTAWVEDVRPYIPKGAAGVGVRTLAELALNPDITKL